MSTHTLEERVAILEAKIEQIEQAKGLDKSDEDTPWWKRIIGIYANCPEFEEAVKFGREWRESEDVVDVEKA